MKYLNLQAVYDKLDNIEKQLSLSTVKYLTTVQASKFLGISITYLYELTSKRLIPFYKPSGKKLLFKHSDLTNWIERSRYNCSEEIQNEFLKNEQ